jgi:hypothetical protein
MAIQSIHDIQRNDLSAAVAFLRAEASRGPLGRDTLQILAMLQDEPRKFYAAIESVEFELK